MALTILKIDDSGGNEERLKIHVDDSITDLSQYAVIDKAFDSEGEISNKLRHFFRFSKISVSKGDYIRLYTSNPPRGVANYHSVKNESKTLTHHFYWNQGNGVWNNDGDTAYIIKLVVESKKDVNG